MDNCLKVSKLIYNPMFPKKVVFGKWYGKCYGKSGCKANKQALLKTKQFNRIHINKNSKFSVRCCMNVWKT